MKQITQLVKKYQTFENKLKQDKFWLFVPLYLVKTAFKYATSLSFAYLICLITGKLYYFLIISNPFFYLYFSPVVVIILFTSPPLSYILLFSRKQITLHPYIVMFIAASIYWWNILIAIITSFSWILPTTGVIITQILVLWLLDKSKSNSRKS